MVILVILLIILMVILVSPTVVLLIMLMLGMGIMIELVLIIRKVLQVGLHKLKDNHQLVCGGTYIEQLHHVLMAELLKQRDLADRCAWDSLLLRIETSSGKRQTL